MNEDIDECCNLKIETISVPNLSTGKYRKKTPKIFKSVKKTKQSASKSNPRFNFSPNTDTSKTPEKQTTVKKRKVSKSRSRSRSVLSPTS
jgi:hypothetical protein